MGTLFILGRKSIVAFEANKKDIIGLMCKNNLWY